MLDTPLPSKIKSLLDLIRFYKPIGFTLLMWPCWFGLASLPINQLNLLKWFKLRRTGWVCMCVFLLSNFLYLQELDIL